MKGDAVIQRVQTGAFARGDIEDKKQAQRDPHMLFLDQKGIS